VARLPDLAGRELSSRPFRAQFLAFSAILDRPLPSYDRGRLENLVTGRAIAQELLPLLMSNESADATYLVQRAWKVVSPFVALTAREREYTDFIARGELRTDLLFPNDTREAERIAQHPAIQWKLRNVRSILAEK
jgi:hypothetical protein